MTTDHTLSRRTLMHGVGAGLAVTSCAGLLSACSGSTTQGNTTASGTPTAPATTASTSSGGAGGAPVKLTFWSWVPNIKKVVKLWNDSHPQIQVAVNTAAQGDALYTKLVTANKAGNPPDLAQVEYQALPSMVVAGVVADISSQVTDAKSKYSQGIWDQVTLGTNAVYGLPQDSGPMMFYYRDDLFDKYGLKLPATWDEFADAAEKLHKANPKIYLTTFSSGDPGWFAGLAAQAGAAWWKLNGSQWTVDINDSATKKVADFWDQLVADGSVDGEKMYTPQWGKDLNDGTLLSWPSAIWGPGVLTSVAPKTKGKWKLAPMPQWKAGDHVTGFWGGSSTAVMKKSEHQAEALQFAQWLNTDPTALEALVKEGGLYPAATSGQQVPALHKAPAFFSNQSDFYTLAGKLAKNAVGFTWGPDVTVTYNSYTEAFGKAITHKTSFSDAVDTMQTTTLSDMKKSGFQVTGG